MTNQPGLEQRCSETDRLLAGFRQAVSDDLQGLALLHHTEPTAEWLDSWRQQADEEVLGLRLQTPAGQEALAAIREALATLPARIDNATLDELAADYADIYLTHAYRASPYESVWLDEDNLMSQEPMFQVRAWYVRYGLTAANWRLRPDDHLSLQLQFIAHLFAQTTGNTLSDAAQFMDEHLLRWLPQFSQRVATRCQTAYFAAIALLTVAYCDEVRELLANLLDKPRPSPEEIAMRMQPRRQPIPAPVAYIPGTGPSW